MPSITREKTKVDWLNSFLLNFIKQQKIVDAKFHGDRT
jgi:hypothetical protein